MYPDEANYYIKKIFEEKSKQYLFEAQAAVNPHTKKPEKLIKALQRAVSKFDDSEQITIDQFKKKYKGKGVKIK